MNLLSLIFMIQAIVVKRLPAQHYLFVTKDTSPSFFVLWDLQRQITNGETVWHLCFHRVYVEIKVDFLPKICLQIFLYSVKVLCKLISCKSYKIQIRNDDYKMKTTYVSVNDVALCFVFIETKMHLNCFMFSFYFVLRNMIIKCVIYRGFCVWMTTKYTSGIFCFLQVLGHAINNKLHLNQRNKKI